MLKFFSNVHIFEQFQLNLRLLHCLFYDPTPENIFMNIQPLRADTWISCCFFSSSIFLLRAVMKLYMFTPGLWDFTALFSVDLLLTTIELFKRLSFGRAVMLPLLGLSDFYFYELEEFRSRPALKKGRRGWFSIGYPNVIVKKALSILWWEAIEF